MRRRAADFGAVLHKPEVLRIDLAVGDFADMIHGFLFAQAVALEAVDDARLQLRALKIAHAAIMRAVN